uniref:PINIT domain-containing protein n=2 Tax=Macrostomum lignano TaxID=282301 RepID=A0A1I8IKY8_9PLAT
MVQLQLNTRCNDIIENLLPTMAQHEVRELLVVLNLSHNGRKARLYRRLLACLDAQSVPISALLKCRSTKLREAARQVDLPRMLFSGVQLPFAEVLGSLIPLTLLIQSEPLSAMQCQLLEFTVKPEHAPLIKAGARLIMRFYKLLGQGESRVDEFPEQLSIRLNSNVLQSEQLAQMRGRVAGVPVDITDHSKTDLCESNKVTVTWCQPDGQRFCLETLLIRYRSVEAELARIPRGSCKSTLFGSLSSGDC